MNRGLVMVGAVSRPLSLLSLIKKSPSAAKALGIFFHPLLILADIKWFLLEFE